MADGKWNMEHVMRKFFPIILFLCSFSVRSQNERLDSLKKVLQTAKEDSSLARTYFSISESIYLFDPDSVIPLCQKAIELCDKHLGSGNDLTNKSYLKIKANSLGNIGFIYSERSLFKQAIEYYDRSREINKRIGNKVGVAITLNNMGQICDQTGDTKGALEYYHKALSLQEEAGNKEGEATCLNNIGFVFITLKDYKNGLDYNKKALAIREKAGNELGIALSMNNLGLVYHKMAIDKDKEPGTDSLYAKAFYYWERSLAIMEKINDKNGIANGLHNLALVYFKRGETAKSIDYIERAIKIQEELQNRHAAAQMINTLGVIHARTLDYKKAEEEGMRALKIAREARLPHIACKASMNLADLFRKVSQLPSTPLAKKAAYAQRALEMYISYKALSDSLMNSDVQKEAVKKQMEHEFEKKEAAIKAEQLKKDMIAEEAKKKQKVILYSVSAGLVLLLFFAIFIYRSFKEKQKANIEITRQKELVEEKQHEILSSIRYAKRIQNSLLPTEKYLDKNTKSKKDQKI
jgi:tetratricopeptide (TPR) repeat protein